MIHPSGMFWCSRGSGRRLESVYGVTDLKIMSQLGKRCQLGLLGLGFAPGLVGLGFSYKKKCIIAYIVYLHVIYCFINAHGCDNGWMA